MKRKRKGKEKKKPAGLAGRPAEAENERKMKRT